MWFLLIYLNRQTDLLVETIRLGKAEVRKQGKGKEHKEGTMDEKDLKVEVPFRS